MAAASTTPESLTEMEKQVVMLKTKYEDMLLLFECGYRMRLFGEDAENAARVLQIRAQRHRAFVEASVPVHRVLFHGRRLVEAGYKIGIVRQLSVAGASRQPLERDVVEVYTRATIPRDDAARDDARESYAETLRDDGESADADQSLATLTDCVDDWHDTPRFILAIVEETIESTRLFTTRVHAMAASNRSLEGDEASGETGALPVKEASRLARAAAVQFVRVGVFGYDVHTGECVMDEFEDDGMRRKMIECLSLVRPVEFVVPGGGVSPQTRQAMDAYMGPHAADEQADQPHPSTRQHTAVRIEQVQSHDRASVTTSARIPALAREGLALMAAYLSSLKLENVPSLESLVTINSGLLYDKVKQRMRLSTAAQRDLGIFDDPGHQPTNHGQRAGGDGSLMKILNHTTTSFGSRRLRDWIAYPLTDIGALQARHDAVEFLSCVTGRGAVVYETLTQDVLPAAVPMERLLQKLHLRRCSPHDVLRLLQTLIRAELHIAKMDDAASDGVGGTDSFVEALLSTYPCHMTELQLAEAAIDVVAAEKNDVERTISRSWAKYPTESAQFETICAELEALEGQFTELLDTYRRELVLPQLEYTSHRTGGFGKACEHLVVVKRADLHRVPGDWCVVNSTKSVVRFYPRQVRTLRLQADILHETKAQLVKRVWLYTIAEVDALVYVKGMACVDVLAQLDAICSLATVVRLYPNYVRPTFSTRNELAVVRGRHPTLEILAAQGFSYIAGDIYMLRGTNCGAATIVSGPNMGGKSTLLRMVALLVVMAQVGSFVPAEAMTLPVCDAIHTRMNRPSHPHAAVGHAELRGLSELLQQATPQSLVLLDEVGYGLTSQQARSLTYNTVTYLVGTTSCFVLMATHARELIQRFRSDGFSRDHVRAIELAHQVVASAGVTEPPHQSSEDQVIFHYTPREGVATRSFAVQAAAMARLPSSVLAAAAAGDGSSSRTVIHEGD